MAFSVKPILEEVSRTALAEQVAGFISKCAESNSTKAILGTVATAAMPVIFPAAILVGMSLFTQRKERENEKEFKAHCDAVVEMLGKLDGNVDASSTKIDELPSKLD